VRGDPVLIQKHQKYQQNGCSHAFDRRYELMNVLFRLIGGLATLAAVCVLSVAVSAQGRNSISGFVYGPGRSAVPEVPVELNTDLGRTLSRTKTDSSGRYVFNGVPFGRIAVHVLPLGTDLDEQTQTIDIGNVGARGQLIPDNIQLDFYLRPRKTERKQVNAVVFVQDVPEEAKKLYEDGIAELERERPVQGVQQLQKAIGIFPTYFAALERLGQEYIKEEKWQDAAEMFSRSTAVNAQSFSSWYSLGYSNYREGKFAPAVEALNRATALNRNVSTVYFVLGASQRRIGQFDEAEKSLLEAQKLDKGKTPDIYWETALLYTYNLKRYQDAADQLELFLKADSKNPNAEGIKKVIARLRQNLPPSE
jgi:Tfp pilus assembly protein PilF